MTLPELFTLDGFTNDQEGCLRRLYDFYEQRIVKANLTFLGSPVSFQRRPEINGMQYGFYHLISEEASPSDKREINYNRCQRIPWIPYVIRNSADYSRIKCWENIRHSNKHVVLWLHEHNYMVILAKRKDYYLLKTAYPIVRDHKVEKLIKESQQYPDPRKN